MLPVEGYGATELSPVVSGNRPPSRDPIARDKCGNHIGTVGQPLAGVEVKVIDVDTGEDLPRGRQGMLLVRGPSVMKGYLHRPDLTAEVMRGDWYVTGDLATIDEDNFITITGRISRFSKIGGEMVPHLRVEAAVREVLAADEPGNPIGRHGRARPDPRRAAGRAAHGSRHARRGNLPPHAGQRHSAAVDPLARQLPAGRLDTAVGHGQARHVAVEGNGGAGVLLRMS